MTETKLLAGLTALLTACQPAANEPMPSNQPTAETASPAPVADTPAPPQPGTPGGLPDDRTPLQEPKGAIDPKSDEAAAQVVQRYAALIEQRKFVEAESLWSNKDYARGLSNELRGYSEAHFQIGKPYMSEGAAGSIYLTVPVVLYGSRPNGTSFSLSGQAVLRRANDVPGSTAAQRRWHIESLTYLERR